MSIENVLNYLKEKEVDDQFLNSLNFQIKKLNLKPVNSHYELSIYIQKELNLIINNYDAVQPEQVRKWLLKIAAMVLLHFSVLEAPSLMVSVGLFSNDTQSKDMTEYLAVARIQALINQIFNASIQRNDVFREYAFIFDLCYIVNS